MVNKLTLSRAERLDLSPPRKKKTSSFRPMEPDRLNSILKKAKAGCIVSRNTIVEENIRLIHAITGKFLFLAEEWGIELDDLFQAGAIGLMKAAEKYDNTRTDSPFHAYAGTIIRQEIWGEVGNNFRIKIGRSAREKLKEANEEKEEKLKNGEDYIEPDDVRELRETVSAINGMKSIHEPITPESDITIGDTIRDKSILGQDVFVGLHFMRDLSRILDLLDSKERIVMEAKFFRLGELDLSDGEIGKMFLDGMGRAGVGLIKKRALGKIGRFLVKEGFVDGVGTC